MLATDYARSIVDGDTLAAKLVPPPAELSFDDRQPAIAATAPGRPRELAIARGRDAHVPPVAGMRDPDQRARIIHALANHELQAIELFAWAVVAFPTAPPAFHRGLIAILADEQRHFALYCERLAALGARFGDHPVTGHFWNKLDHLTGPLEFVCTMGLTFENANLDFAGDYRTAALACGDVATAEVLDRVHRDEIRHVHFAYLWLTKFADPARSPWNEYLARVKPPLGPHRARGARFDRTARERAGLDETFIAGLAAAQAKRPNGAAR